LLAKQISFEEMIADIVANANVIRRKIVPYADGITPAEKAARQVIFRIQLRRPELCDLFFNGRDGLRGRYWHSAKIGNEATRFLLRALQPMLLDDVRRRHDLIEVDAEAAPMDERDVRISLTKPSAKVWPVETAGERFGLEVARWRGNPHPVWGDAWTWTPSRSDLEVKGALIDLEHHQHVPPKKRDRARQINSHGFS
jgi:hypothetical protein